MRPIIFSKIGEVIADQQQWKFQSQKEALKESGQPLTEEYAVGFLRTGLFAYCRHPNYLCEMAIWYSYYLFTWAATGVFLNWTLVGAFPLVTLRVVLGAQQC